MRELQQGIRSIRLSKKMGLKELALKANIPYKELSQCERGLILPNSSFFDAVAKILSVNSTELMEIHKNLLGKITPGEGYVTATDFDSFIIPRTQPLSNNKFFIIDLFCGTGGFSHGFELTGQFEVSVAIDLLPDRVKTFSANHKTANVFCSDIRKINISNLLKNSPVPDIIIGGPPCQGFSSIRPFRTLTEDDPRNNLFEYFILTLSKLQPKWFIIENVVGLLTHKNGQTFESLIMSLENLNYKVDWNILNAALYGLPQRRERLIIIGNTENKKFCWPAPTHYFNSKSMAGNKYNQKSEQLQLSTNSLFPAITIMEAIHDLPEIEAGQSSDKYKESVVLTDYEKQMRRNEQELTLHEATNHSSRMIEIIKKAGSNRNILPEGMTSSGFSTCYSRLEPDLPAVTLTVNFVHPASNKCIHPFQNRALTIREGARLQGFEDSYKFIGSRTQIVKQIGNAVPPLIGKVIADSLLNQM